MSTSELMGKQVALTISDPWEFGERCGVGPFYGHIADVDEAKILMVLARPIQYEGITYRSARCKVRHEGYFSSDLLIEAKSPLSMNVTLLHVQAHRFADLTDDAFRSNLATIGELSLT